MDIHAFQHFSSFTLANNPDVLFEQLVAILHNTQSYSETFKTLYCHLFDKVCGLYSNQRRDGLKETLLGIKGIVWLLPQMKTYPSIFVFLPSDVDKCADQILAHAIRNMLKLDGEHLHFNPDGTLFRRYFMKNGMMEGLCTHYYHSGKVKIVFDYLDDVPREIKAYDEDGTLQPPSLLYVV